MRRMCDASLLDVTIWARHAIRMSFLVWLRWLVLVSVAGIMRVRAREYFQVEIETSEQSLAYTTNPTPVFTVNFNARNLTDLNPLKLFEISGSNRVDVVYSPSLGEMFVMAAVENASLPGTVVLTVNEGVTSSEQGGSNSYAQAKVAYVPASQQGNAVADIAGWGMLGGLAVSFGATLLAPGAAIGVGAMNFAGFVQTFYMSGNLPITNMPDNYRSSTSGLVADWVLLNPPTGPIVEEETSKKKEKEAAIGILQNMSVRLPYPPVVVTFQDAGDIVVSDIVVDGGDGDGGDANGGDANGGDANGGDANGDDADGGGEDGQKTEIESAPAENGAREAAPAENGAREAAPVTEETKPVEDPKPTVDVEEKTATPTNDDDNDATETVKETRVKVEGDPKSEESNDEEDKSAGENGADVSIDDSAGEDDNSSDTGVQENSLGDEDDENDEDEDDEDDDKDSLDDRPPKKPPVVRPIPEEELNGEDGKPLNPFKPPPEKPPPKRPAGANDDDGRKPPPDGPFVEPLMGDDGEKKKGDKDKKQDKETDGEKNKDRDESKNGGDEHKDDGRQPQAPKPEDDEGPFVEPLMGDDDGGNTKDDAKNEWFDDGTVYEDVEYILPKLPSDADAPREPSVGDQEAKDGTNDVGDEESKEREESQENEEREESNGGRRLLLSSLSHTTRRQLMLADPISSLGSSGFSYVIVTATSDDVNGNMTIVESSGDAVGASILSRIRAIEVLGESSDSINHLDVLWNVLFWSAILLSGVAVVHLAILGVIRMLKFSHTPKMLHFPRVELLTFTMIVPMIAAAGAAALRSDSAGTIAAGVCFGILLPFGFLIGASFFLVYAVFRPTVAKRRAVYVLSEDSPMFFMPSDEQMAAIRQRASQATDVASPINSIRSERFSDASDEESADAAADITRQNGRPGQVTTATNYMSNILYKYFLSPLFGFDSPKRAAHVPGDANISQESAKLQWLGRGKTDGDFVKRFGLFFEDAHGPQVVRVRSRYEWNSADVDERNTVGGAVLVPSVEGAMEILQTFAIIFAATKMVLFAVIINAPGGVNHFAQVIALALVSLLHIAYLRICVPYRLRIELMAELVAAVMDLAVFICGIILVAVSDWSPAARSRMGTAMIVLQAIGFLVFITVRLGLALRTCLSTFKLHNLDIFSRGKKRKREGGQHDHSLTQGAETSKVTKVQTTLHKSSTS